jgi:hypothetical protein
VNPGRHLGGGFPIGRDGIDDFLALVGGESGLVAGSGSRGPPAAGALYSIFAPYANGGGDAPQELAAADTGGAELVAERTLRMGLGLHRVHERLGGFPKPDQSRASLIAP